MSRLKVELRWIDLRWRNKVEVLYGGPLTLRPNVEA